MLRRITAYLTLLVLMISCTAIAEKMSTEKTYDTLTVGSTTRIQGEFFTEAWGNATSDFDVKDLLHGYNLIRWDSDNGMFVIDGSVVSGITVGETEEGDRSYILALQDDLYYSDGTPITAWDYAFSFLLRISPEMQALGAQSAESRYIFGYNAYVSGDATSLTGIRVTADNMLTVTVHHEFLPFFYELGLLRCNPYPIHVIAPGVEVRDDGNGVYIANKDPEVEEPLFTVELLKKTLCDPETGYRSHPSVVSGPYMLNSWDGTTAKFEINTYFKGNYKGEKPEIQQLVYTLTTNETMIDDLLEGKLDLLNKVTNTQTIQQGVNAVGQGALQFSSYPRLGLSYISFCCERETVASQAVRQAIAWCVDRDQVVQDYTGNFGLRSDGYYGIGQWIYGVLNGTIAPPIEEPDNSGDTEAMVSYEAKREEWDKLIDNRLNELTVYTIDLERARMLLENDGWKLNDQGVREKEIGGQIVQLDLTMYYPAGNQIAESLAECMVPNLEQVGIYLKMEPIEMQKLLAMYYRQEPRTNDMFYLASNFDLIFDPSAGFEMENGTPTWRYTAYADETLYELASDMRQTVPGDVLEYCQKWVIFQKRFNETLPMIPLYTNVYFDFYTKELHDYQISENVSWAQAIIGATRYPELEEE